MLIVSINQCNLLSKSSILALLPPHVICFTAWPFRVLSEVVNNRQEKNSSLRPCHNARSASKFLGKVHRLATGQFHIRVRLCTCLSFCQAPPQHAFQTKALPTKPVPPSQVVPRGVSGAKTPKLKQPDACMLQSCLTLNVQIAQLKLWLTCLELSTCLINLLARGLKEQ